MTDREMLELAAKAAGYDLLMWHVGGAAWMSVGKMWNPLTDDGDALRMAVKLGMEVYVDTHPDGCKCTEAQSHTYSRPDNRMRSIVNHGDDLYAATRRAIVRAAAEIGRDMG